MRDLYACQDFVTRDAVDFDLNFEFVERRREQCGKSVAEERKKNA